MNADPPWKPTRKELRLLWYLQALMRYGVGGGGLIWCLLINQLADPIALLVFGALATSTDVFGFARTLIKQAREETLELEQAAEQEEGE
jgi:hypothetical protein